MLNEAKLPPQDKQMETAVLGAILLEKNTYEIAAEILSAESFYVDFHKHVFQAMTTLNNKGQPIDMLTVTRQMIELGNKEQDLPYRITVLTNSVTSSAHLEAHCRKIKLLHLKRLLYTVTSNAAHDAIGVEAGPYEIIEQLEQELTRIANLDNVKSYTTLNDEVFARIGRIEELRAKGEDVTGVPSGFVALDKITKGWQVSDLIILAARPSVGKTAFAVNLARNAAMNARKTSVAFFSLEMSSGQIVDRLLAAETGIDAENIKNGQCTDENMTKLYAQGVGQLAGAPIFLDDTAALNFFELRAKARRLKRKHNIGLIIIDYLQLMSGGKGKGNREQEISEISRNLKGLAKELQIPIIALSQLSRALEGRADNKKIPQLSDLRESGAIEQDADMVMFLYRPEYHEINEQGYTSSGETHVKIAKHRNGPLGTIYLQALLHIQKFIPAVGNATSVVPVRGWRPVSDAFDDKESVI